MEITVCLQSNSCILQVCSLDCVTSENLKEGTEWDDNYVKKLCDCLPLGNQMDST